jgi:hypothetical protein
LLSTIRKYYFSDNTYVSIFCGGQISFNTCHWTADFHGSSHVLGFTEKGLNYLFAYSQETRSYTINQLNTGGPRQVNRGTFDVKWDSFFIKEYNGHALLVSVNADRTDTGLLKSTGYQQLDSQPNLSDKVKGLLKS